MGPNFTKSEGVCRADVSVVPCDEFARVRPNYVSSDGKNCSERITHQAVREMVLANNWKERGRTSRYAKR